MHQAVLSLCFSNNIITPASSGRPWNTLCQWPSKSGSLVPGRQLHQRKASPSRQSLVRVGNVVWTDPVTSGCQLDTLFLLSAVLGLRCHPRAFLCCLANRNLSFKYMGFSLPVAFICRAQVLRHTGSVVVSYRLGAPCHVESSLTRELEPLSALVGGFFAVSHQETPGCLIRNWILV